MFFGTWKDLGRVLVVGLLAYVALVVLLRVSGNRTLSKLNAFDLVVTVALGSTLATVLLDKDLSLGEGVTAFALLVGLQFVVTWSSARSRRFHRLVTSEPVLLVSRGRMLEPALRHARVTEDEIRAVLRKHGVADVEHVDAVVLESDGSLSVLQERSDRPGALRDVRPPPASERDGSVGPRSVRAGAPG